MKTSIFKCAHLPVISEDDNLCCADSTNAWQGCIGVCGGRGETQPLKSTAQVQLSHIPGVQGEEAVDVNINSDNDLGTIYSVSIPVRRVKPAFDMNEMADAGIDASWEDDEEPAGAKKEPATKSP